jgi:hypothetical protein
MKKNIKINIKKIYKNNNENNDILFKELFKNESLINESLNNESKIKYNLFNILIKYKFIILLFIIIFYI